MDDYPTWRRPNRTNAAMYYVLLAAFALAIAGQVAVPQSIVAEPDARRRLAPLSADNGQASRRVRNVEGISRLLGNSTNGKQTISAIEQRKADDPQQLTLTGEVVTAPFLPPRGGSPFSPRLPSRDLQDYELEDIVLLGTIDGSIYASDRKTGRTKWSLDFPTKPMIETINYPRNRSTEDESGSEDEYIFIVEPSRAGTGNLYVQNRNPSRGGLQKLGTTVQDLANAGAHTITGTSYSVASSQKSLLYVIDAATGSVLRRIDVDDPFMNIDGDQSCPRLDPFGVDAEECEAIGTFVLGRKEYNITIMDIDTLEFLCRIQYAQWTINNRDTELQIQHNATPLERRQILSFSNGQIIGMDGEDEYGRPEFRAKFDSPVIQVFDVARPVDTKGTSTSLVVLSQPLVLSQDANSLDLYQGLSRDRTKVFVNKTVQGSYFLMSEEQYPFSTSTGPKSRLFQGIDTERSYIGLDSEEESMTGVHKLTLSSHDVPLLDAPPAFNKPKEMVPARDSNILPISSAVSTQQGSRPLYLWLGLATLAASIVWFFNSLKQGSRLARNILILVEQCTGLRIQYRSVKQRTAPEKAVRQGNQSDNRDEKDTPRIVAINSAKGIEQVVARELMSHTIAESTNGSVGMEHSRQGSHKLSSDEESADWEKVPVEALHGIEMADASVHDGNDCEQEPGADQHDEEQHAEGQLDKKVRTLPRKRGGKKNKKKPSRAVEDALVTETNSLMNVASVSVADVPVSGPIQPVSIDGQTATPDPAFVPELQLESGMTQVGVITVDQRMSNILGEGSNGTFVFRGTFGSRAVAVKRLIRSHRNFAAAEIKHLPELDGHSNVVRFWCVQESQHFTWIALDLFTTALDKIVEQPEQHLDLVPTAGLDVNDILCQIARGVEHLHSCRVVHRDIKPQNVLVRPLQPGYHPIAGRPNLLVVLSDFGLCKLLDDGPGSAFALTGNHTAAGTTGWKAPELLAGGPSAIITVDAGSSVASNHTSTSSQVDVPPGQKSHRPGKAIDIFSMGCLFFYVMTQGNHPFDRGGSYLRDANIRENKPETHDLLSFHNYSFEADDLILQMINHEPQHRPTASHVLQHPYFWTTERKLQFLCDVSDCYERDKVAQTDREAATKTAVSSVELDALEAKRSNVWTGNDFLKRLPARIITEAGKQRKYTGSRMIDLLRLIRNKKNHFHDLPPEIKFGEMDGTLAGYYRFWSAKFPSLLVNMHCLIIERELMDNPEFMELRKYFE